MSTLETTVNGLKLPNPFVIGSGPPGTNANVIGKAFDEGWGAVICKTVSLDAGKVVNVLSARAQGNLQVQQQVEFEVIAPGLTVALQGPERRYLERRLREVRSAP